MKKAALLLYFISCTLYSAFAQNESLCDTLQSNRFVMRSTLYGIGYTNILDTYLSPAEYKGMEARIVHERMRMTRMMKGMFTRNLWSKLGYLLCKAGVRAMRGRLDYNEAGGTMLLGIAKPVIKAHGSSKARAIRSAIAQAKQVVEQGVAEKNSENIAAKQLPMQQ